VKIALIRPNLGDYRSSDAMPPLAMGILAARSEPHDVVLYDEKVEPIPLDLDADLIAFSVETFTAHRAYQLADHYRARRQRVVMGGYHPTFLPDEALLHADAVVTGDAEGSWEQLLLDAEVDCLQRLYVGDNNASLTDFRIDRSIYAGKRYAPIELVQYGRGCRFACDFCSIHTFYGTSVRVRPAERLARELETINRKRLLFFVDDNLFSNIEDLNALLTMLKPMKLRWSCQISIDVARDPAMLDKLAEAGCSYVLIGFESLVRENLLQMGKRWNNVAGSYKHVIDELHQRGIGIYGTFVFGYDYDTPDTMARSVDFAIESRLEIANFNPLTPTPGSALYKRLMAEGRMLSPKWWLDPNYRYGDPIFVPRGMTPEQLARGCFDAKKTFYSWPSIGKRVFDGDQGFSVFKTSMTAIANMISRREIYQKQGRFLGI
jgi:radical SAM superfamily enzyme YgiQ (UPF0313 family)